MRCYDARHTVAVLRKIIGLSQSEMAALVGCSKRTIQAIEIGRLSLSASLATKISHETGIAEGWLLAGDIHAPPRLILTDEPYDKRFFDATRAAIAAGRNPNPLTISLTHEGPAFLKAPPIQMMEKVFEDLNSLLHPQMDYWLASILAAIFAATKAGQARLAIRRLSNFTANMKKEFGLRLDDEFINDATVVFEQALQRIKITELLVEKHAGKSEPPSSSTEKKDKPAHKDLLANWQFISELQGYDEETLYAELNGVGERLKARFLSSQKLYDVMREQMMAVFRAPKPGGPKHGPSKAPNPPEPAANASEKPRKERKKS